MRVAVVGAGSIGREFALNHFGEATGTRVTCIIDRNAALAQALAADVGSVQAGVALGAGSLYQARPVEARGQTLLHFAELSPEALDLCDLVYVGTPPTSHREVAVAALDAGKHVVLEKPLAASPEDADAIVAAAEVAAKHGSHTSVNIGMRWNSALHRMRQELAAGRIGVPVEGFLRLHFRTWPREWQLQPWVAMRDQGGALREVGTHFLFGIHELFGHGCIRSVKGEVAYADGLDGELAEESATGVLELVVDGKALNIQVSLLTTGQTELEAQKRDIYELEIHGDSGGALQLFDFAKLRDVASGEVLVPRASYGRRECVEELLAAVEGKNKSSRISAREARNAQRVLDAFLASRGEWTDICYD